MGDDGHTASLFPSTAAVHEPVRWVVAHRVEELDAWRVTLTPVVLNAAANVLFVISGEGKSERLREVLEGPHLPEALPAQVVKPSAGRLVWMVDEAAAAELSGR
jgi:6-phosphogluconolactonase